MVFINMLNKQVFYVLAKGLPGGACCGIVGSCPLEPTNIRVGHINDEPGYEAQWVKQILWGQNSSVLSTFCDNCRDFPLDLFFASNYNLLLEHPFENAKES